MPKQKTHKGIAKRIRVTSTGKLVRSKAGRRHLLAHKSSKRKRALRRRVLIAQADMKRLKTAMTY